MKSPRRLYSWPQIAQASFMAQTWPLTVGALPSDRSRPCGYSTAGGFPELQELANICQFPRSVDCTRPAHVCVPPSFTGRSNTLNEENLLHLADRTVPGGL